MELKKTKETWKETKKKLTNKINVQKAVIKHREKKKSFEAQGHHQLSRAMSH